MQQGHQTWVFNNRPVIASTAAVVGPFEGRGPLANDFDLIHGDSTLNQESWEKAEKVLFEDAAQLAIEQAGLLKEQIDFFHRRRSDEPDYKHQLCRTNAQHPLSGCVWSMLNIDGKSCSGRLSCEYQGRQECPGRHLQP